MGGLIGLVVLVLDIIAIVDLFKSAKDTGKKILWLILILVLPLIGMILYFVVGKKK
ncbi:MAG: PLDc N-terminal domain-containing protein [Candidatus Omnitrophota bacterium]|nr:PLDc N-terminal domain-containing protein [Candidatus Omnitrophota bacterium]